MRYCMVRFKRRSEVISYRVYVTDALKCIAENTTGGDSRQHMTDRYYYRLGIEPEAEDDRTPEEIIDSVLNGLARVRGREISDTI